MVMSDVKAMEIAQGDHYHAWGVDGFPNPSTHRKSGVVPVLWP